LSVNEKRKEKSPASEKEKKNVANADPSLQRGKRNHPSIDTEKREGIPARLRKMKAIGGKKGKNPSSEREGPHYLGKKVIIYHRERGKGKKNEK